MPTTPAPASLKRPDGTMQVACNGWPLYYFIKGKAPDGAMGQVCQRLWCPMVSGRAQ
ncbi:MAG: hypothetical protein H5U29_00885 [Pusillimonas sp.]|nr:hypothetical protein [Pusillimonas sp.]